MYRLATTPSVADRQTDRKLEDCAQTYRFIATELIPYRRFEPARVIVFKLAYKLADGRLWPAQ